MKCANPHCRNHVFSAVIEMDDNRAIGLKCMNCQARYSIDDDIEIKKSIEKKRLNFWNSVKWKLGL